MLKKTFAHAMRASRHFIVYASLVIATVLPVEFHNTSFTQTPRWETYSDQRFGFQIRYPNGWYIFPRDDSDGQYGATLSFSNIPFPEGEEQISSDVERVVVTVGFYLAEIQAGESINQWSLKYEGKARIDYPADISITEGFLVPVSRRNGWRLGGEASLGNFHVVMIPVEKVVWFIWSNADKGNLGIYDRMVASFNVGNKAPKSLKDIYGEDFQPTSLLPSTQPPKLAAGAHRASPIQASDPAGYRLPFTGQKTITQGPGCGATHVGRSSEAIDYSMTTGTAVKATYAGVTAFAGWNNQGFGNLIQIDHGPSPIKRSYYAHLQSMFVTSGTSVSKGQHIANSDNTGNSTGPHLHFEVRLVSSNSSIWIRTLPTTVWYSGNANSPCTGTGDDYDGYATGP